MEKTYRKGAIGALTDEYEKALEELKVLLIKIPDDKFIEVYNKEADTDFRSIKNIVSHVIRSGYVYANHIRKRFGNNYVVPEIEIIKTEEGISELNKMFDYIQSRIPVLCSNLPEMAKIVEIYGIGVTIRDRDPENIARVVRFMLEEHDSGAWDKALEKAAELLCWENESDQYLEVVKESGVL